MGLVKSVCALQLLYLVKPTKITLRFDEFNRAITDGLDTCDKHKGAGSRTYDTMSWRREENNGVNIADQDSKKVLQGSLNVIGHRFYPQRLKLSEEKLLIHTSIGSGL